MSAKLVAGVVLTALVGVFILQNTEVVDIRFFFWTLSMSRAVMIFLVFLVGLVSGWLLQSYVRHKRRNRT
jgi:uncharacterized integral membrane protein